MKELYLQSRLDEIGNDAKAYDDFLKEHTVVSVRIKNSLLVKIRKGEVNRAVNEAMFAADYCMDLAAKETITRFDNDADLKALKDAIRSIKQGAPGLMSVNRYSVQYLKYLFELNGITVPEHIMNKVRQMSPMEICCLYEHLEGKSGK